MKLKEFNRENTMSRTGGRNVPPRVSINFKSGLFRFSTTALGLLKLKAGEELQICQDEEKEEDWYLEKVQRGGFILVEREKKDGHALAFCSATLARTIAASVVFTGSTGRLLIGPEPVDVSGRTLWKIDTKLLRNK